MVQIVTADPLANDNRFQVEGSAGTDNISIGDVNTPLAVTGGSLRAHFELDGFQRLWVRGNAGADVIDNISRVPGVLDGGAGNDTINSIVNDPLSKFVLQKKIVNSQIRDVTLVLGNQGADQLFVGAGAADTVLPAGSVQAAIRAFPDKGITFLIGDLKPGSMQADGRFKSLDVVNPPFGEPGDTYSSSANAFQHGLIALRDFSGSNRARGIFKFGAGDSVKFSTTIAWLKAQIFLVNGKTIKSNQLVQLLSRQLETFTKPVADSGEPEGAMFLAAPLRQPSASRCRRR